MRRHLIIAVLVLSIMSSTMVVGCAGGPLLTSLITLPLQFIGAMMLDQFVGPLLGDPAGDLGGGGEPVDD